ncbi:MAG TPA: bifunctional 5,10-methylenetetrahydrofolate dehydrogenase/5,10-methenyltetrahydrofolate cyclohydrolase [Candidatus Magasanikbacteria bacterium]|nr:bifunctional 5,10-methylenetetrahydrofolate dehydrogenase/5,10-methenyltetrahydrofolate cyclohydrolase [Candidatus Magasanikbacteria bacterium]
MFFHKPATIINGKQIAKSLLDSLKPRIINLKTRGITPQLVVFMVGDHRPSITYVNRKKDAAEALGINFSLHTFPADVSEMKLSEAIRSANEDLNTHGIIVQLPLPDALPTRKIINTITPEKDVDCMTDKNLGRLVMGNPKFTPPTPEAVFTILRELNIDPAGHTVTIVGTGPLVGKPLAVMMIDRRATVTTCNHQTTDLRAACRSAEILITAVGKKDLIRGDMIRRDTIVIDTGISFSEKIMYGDVHFASTLRRAQAITPVPGGVGPITVSLLIENTITAAERA